MVNGGKVTVYTTDPCGFCRQAKALLESRGVDYVEISLTKDPDGRAALVQRTGQMTFPQIIAGSRVIGGFRELLEADRDGMLGEILTPAADEILTPAADETLTPAADEILTPAAEPSGNGDRSRSRVPLP